MTENHHKFKDLMRVINFSQAYLMDEGRIEKIHIKSDTMTITFLLCLPTVLKIEVMEELIKKIETYFLQFGYHEVIVQFQYDESKIETTILNHYFETIINKLEAEKPRFSIFQKRNYQIEDKEITLFVANEDEREMLIPLISPIEQEFVRYGLHVPIEIKISSFEIPIETFIQKNIQETEIQTRKEQEAYDQLVKEEKQKSDNNTDWKGKSIRKKRRSVINKEPTPIKDIPASNSELIEYRTKYGNTDFVIIGDIVQSTITEKNRRNDPSSKFKIYEALIKDKESSITIKTFIDLDNGEEKNYIENANAGKKVRAAGYADYDNYSKDVVLHITDFVALGEADKDDTLDLEPVRRVELHAHTKMTVQDSVMDVRDYVSQAVKFKHQALAVTDTHNIHVFPDFYKATKDLEIKPIFGVEGALIDEEQFKIALSDESIVLKQATYVVYDLETTGLSSHFNEIIEIAAVKVKNGIIVDDFSRYVKPKRPITPYITNLTSITNDDVRFADSIEIVMPTFYEFIKDCILVAHNANFDNSFLYHYLNVLGIYHGTFPTIDTLPLAKVKYGHKLKTFNLKAVAKFFDVDLEQHHRAIYDAKTTANVFIKMLNDIYDNNEIDNYNQLNQLIQQNEVYKLDYPYHITVLVKNKTGKKNLYKIITDSHTVHYAKEPIMVKSFLASNREGLLLGSGCINGEIFRLAYERSEKELQEAMAFYDFIEVQPPSVCEVLTEKNQDPAVNDFIKQTIELIIRTAKEMKKLVVATGDVHHLTKDDLRLREIYIAAPKLGGGVHDLVDLQRVPSMHFMNTREMLDEFSFLNTDLAHEIVVTNTNKIADMIEVFELFPNQLFAPQDDFMKDRGVPSFKQGVIDITYQNAYERYGNPLPQYVSDRIDKELSSIIGNNFAAIYYISYLLVKYSTDEGYIVGSRGSVGSSLVANLMKITEVNPLPPHYTCPHCHLAIFKMSEEEEKIYPRTEKEKTFLPYFDSYETGYDLPSVTCPDCHTPMIQDGVNIPFETFLGFKGDKIPDIDLNFSGEYQGKAHEFCRELFGMDHAFRAGTISTIAEKTAYGYVRRYIEKKGIPLREAEISRLAKQIEGVKRSTGQHPGGIVVIPKEVEYTDIIPVQFPADDVNATWRTTHFDYHSFESNLLKLDILGHDDPTMIRHLMSFIEKYPSEFPFSKVEEIPLTDKDVLGLFQGLASLKLTADQMAGERIGTTGIPEFGTSLTKDMLSETNPQTFSDLLKISGLSHGTNVWNGNAKDFLLGLKEGYPPVPFKELIGCRDDIMVYLLSKKMPANDAFRIMEDVRKNKGVSKDFEKKMLAYNVPKWYIESCKLIEYMFPKAHATAYVIMALRIGWFKIHRPIFYYAAYFSRRADAFDVVAMANGYDAIKAKVVELSAKIKSKQASVREIDTHTSLLLALEMTARGYRFLQIDIEYSDATNFRVSKDRKSLLIPFNALESLGESTALSIVQAREELAFTSKHDIIRRTKINTTLFERMNMLGIFGKLPDDDQMGLF
ncbi:MAG: PolC-type DNA polymerase III [Bacilli bacterium]|jgi:DNA polymerase-3 subunit alpha (Gram-positive type)|nr:PolC-type DNA polymerase III [Bacilli bacterium]